MILSTPEYSVQRSIYGVLWRYLDETLYDCVDGVDLVCVGCHGGYNKAIILHTLLWTEEIELAPSLMHF